MIDPITAFSAASAAFGILKKGISVGKDITSMGSTLSQWSKAVADIDFLEQKSKKPPMYKMFSDTEASALDIWTKKQKLKEMTLQFDQEFKLQELQISSRKEELESERAIAEMESVAEMKSASYAHDASYGPTTVFISSMLRFVRPVLTFLLLAFTGYIFWQVRENPSIVHELSNQIMFLTTTAVAWWFGDRSLRK